MTDPTASNPSNDPLDIPLPADVTIGHVRFRKGVSLRTFVGAAERWHMMRLVVPNPEIEHLMLLLHEVYRDAELPQVLRQKVWDAING